MAVHGLQHLRIGNLIKTAIAGIYIRQMVRPGGTQQDAMARPCLRLPSQMPAAMHQQAVFRFS